MTRIGVISDVHGDVEGLEAALAGIRRAGGERTLFLGDVVGRTADHVGRAVALLRAARVVCVKGNNDRPSSFGGRLTSAAAAFLARLPPSWQATVEGVALAAWHASPGSTNEYVYARTAAAQARLLVERAACDVLLLGHTHEPMAVAAGPGRLIANPGSVDGRDRAEGGTYGILEVPARRFVVRRIGDDAELLRHEPPCA